MRRLVTLTLALSLVGSSALSAQKPKKQKGKSKRKPKRPSSLSTLNARPRARTSSSTTVGQLPPGLAKKNNGCLPPGQAKKRYVIGQPLARGIVVGELPVESIDQDRSRPAGYRYGILDGDLVKLAVGTLLVVDAIDGLVR